MAEAAAKASAYLQPIILQLVGLGMLIASLIYWFLSGRQSVLMVSASMSLIGLGAYSKTVGQISSVVKDVSSAVDAVQKVKE